MIIGSVAASPTRKKPLRHDGEEVFDIRLLTLKKQSFRIFEHFFDFDEELYRFRSVYDSVVVREGDVHHRTVFHAFGVDGDGTKLDFVHAENTYLRRVQDWSRQQGAEYAAVRDRERSALKLGQFQRVVAGFAGQLNDRALDLGESETVRFAKNRND